MTIRVRNAAEQDAAALAKILCESWQSAFSGILMEDELTAHTDPTRREKMFARLLKAPAVHIAVCEADGCPVGLVIYGTCRDEDCAGCGEIIGLHSLVKSRKQGCGRALMDFAAADLIRLGFSEAVLWVFEKNRSARGFYEKYGFRPDGAFKESAFGEGVDEMRYRLPLNRPEIERCIREALTGAAAEAALEFAAFLQESGMDFERFCSGYWKDKHYWAVRYRGEAVCFLSLKDPDEPEIGWTVWSDDSGSDCYAAPPPELCFNELAGKYVDHCAACGSCGGGTKKTVFGKEYDNVCRTVFRFDDPDAEALSFMKMMVQLRRSEVENTR